MSLAFLSVNTVIATASVGFFLPEKVACGPFSTACCLWELSDFREVLPSVRSLMPISAFWRGQMSLAVRCAERWFRGTERVRSTPVMDLRRNKRAFRQGRPVLTPLPAEHPQRFRVRNLHSSHLLRFLSAAPPLYPGSPQKPPVPRLGLRAVSPCSEFGGGGPAGRAGLWGRGVGRGRGGGGQRHWRGARRRGGRAGNGAPGLACQRRPPRERDAGMREVSPAARGTAMWPAGKGHGSCSPFG